MIIIYLLLSVFSAVSTYALSVKYKQSPVRSSAAATLLFSFFLMALSFVFDFGLNFNFETQNLLEVFFGASFVGMCSQNKFSYKHVFSFSIVFFFLYLFLFPIIPVKGGALGFCAFLSVAIPYAFTRLPYKNSRYQ